MSTCPLKRGLMEERTPDYSCIFAASIPGGRKGDVVGAASCFGRAGAVAPFLVPSYSSKMSANTFVWLCTVWAVVLPHGIVPDAG